jgi:hypothetical protein
VASGAPVLGQQNTITGSRAGYTLVQLDQSFDPFTTAAGKEPSYELRGDGQIVGAELRSLRPLPGGQYQSLLVLGIGGPGNSTQLVEVGGSRNFVPGTYRLYLISDRPASVTLRFPGLAAPGGAVTADTPTPFDSGSLPPHTGVGMTTFGREGSIVSYDGLLFVRATVRENAPLADRLELCMYYAGTDTGSSAYGPGCPGGHSLDNAADPTGQGLGRFAIVFGVSAGSYGLGGNLNAVDPTASLQTFAMWFSPDPAGTPYPSPRPLPPGTTPGASSPGTSSPAVAAAVTLTSTQIRVAGRYARVRLRCAQNSACRGRVALSIGGRIRSFMIPADQIRAVPVRLGRTIVHRLRHHQVSVLVIIRVGVGARTETRQPATLLR